MIVQQGSLANFMVPCDLPNYTAGVPSWTNPVNAVAYKNGSAASFAGALNLQVSAGVGPALEQIELHTGDTDTLGTLSIVLTDAGGQVVCVLVLQVVAYDPSTGPAVADPLANVPTHYAAGQVGANMNAAITAVIYLLTSGKNPPGS